MVTTNDIQALISFAILNNKSGVIQAMNSTGNVVASDISEDDLAVNLWNIFSQQGISALKNILSKVPVNPTKITQQQAQALVVKFKDVNPNTKFGDWIKGVGNYFGDLLGGSSVTGGTVQQMFTESALSPTMIVLIIVLGMTLIIIFKKSLGVVIGIMALVLGLVLYGIFSKKITTVVTGGTTTTHGGVGQVFLAWLKGL